MANGSTRVNATYTTSGAVGDYIQFNWSSASSSVTGNYTDVSWSLVLYSLANGQIYSSASKSWSVTVNGSTYSGTNTIGIGNNTSKTLASGSTRIYHNADGTKSFSYSFSQTFNITFNSWVGTVSGSSSGTLDKIPRYAAIKSFSFSDITQTSATCSWTADSNCSKIDYYVNGTLHNSVSISSSSGTYTLDHLSHSTLYSVYFVLTRMDSGLTTQSETKSFTTQPITSLLPEQTFSFTVGEDLTLSFQNPDMNSSMLKLSLENDDGEWINDVISTEVPVGTVSYDWELSAYSDLLYGYCKTRNMMNIRISCGVILDGNYQDNKYTGTALIANSNPVFHSCVLTNTDDTIATLLGSSSSVESWGNFQIQIPPEQKAVAQNGAEIVKYIADMISSPDSSTSIKSAEAAYSSDSQVNLDLGNYTEPGTYLICVYAIDSRKNTSEIVQIPCTIYPYHVPTSSIFLQRMNGFEKEIFLSLSIEYSRLLVDMVSKNNIVSLAYRYAVSGSELPDEWTPITGFSTEIIDTANERLSYNRNTLAAPFLELPNDSSFQIEFQIKDQLHTVVVQSPIEQGIPIMGEFDDGHVTVGMLPDMEDTSLLQVDSDILAKDSVGTPRKIFETLSNLLYLSDLEPSEQILGGIWLEDVTETYTNGG